MLRRLDGASSIFFEKAMSLLDISPPNTTNFEREKRSMMMVWNLGGEIASCEPGNNKALLRARIEKNAADQLPHHHYEVAAAIFDPSRLAAQP
jgi:hypothetical protein